jgi:hypothetical protein
MPTPPVVQAENQVRTPLVERGRGVAAPVEIKHPDAGAGRVGD